MIETNSKINALSLSGIQHLRAGVNSQCGRIGEERKKNGRGSFGGAGCYPGVPGAGDANGARATRFLASLMSFLLIVFGGPATQEPDN